MIQMHRRPIEDGRMIGIAKLNVAQFYHRHVASTPIKAAHKRAKTAANR